MFTCARILYPLYTYLNLFTESNRLLILSRSCKLVQYWELTRSMFLIYLALLTRFIEMSRLAFYTRVTFERKEMSLSLFLKSELFNYPSRTAECNGTSELRDEIPIRWGSSIVLRSRVPIHVVSLSRYSSLATLRSLSSGPGNSK